MTDTFSPPRTPSVDSEKSVKPKVIRADFGDGYSQRAGDGLNAIRKNYKFMWDALTNAEATELEEFFEAKAGYIAFWYTPPLESTALPFICTEWNKTYGEATYKVSATFERVYDILL